MAQACTLISKVRQGDHRIVDHTVPVSEPLPRVISQDGFAIQLPPRVAVRFTPATDASSSSEADNSASVDPEVAELEHEANRLMKEIAVWDQAANFTPFHPRTQYGNHSYRHAIRIRLLREVFRVSASDPRVKASVEAILELAKELLALYGRITWCVQMKSVSACHLTRPGSHGRF
jgi:hypothetical protein